MSIMKPDPTVELFTDASNLGWDGHTDGKKTRGFWSEKEAELHINAKELLASFLSLKAFKERLQNRSVMLVSDSSTVVPVVNGTGSRAVNLNEMMKEIWTWCKIHNVTLQARRISSEENYIADRLSRKSCDCNDWRLNPEVFEMLKNEWGPLCIDMFATRNNAQTEKYWSLLPDPQAERIDAFAQCWTGLSGLYANPPWVVMARVLAKVIQDKATIVLVFPFWQGAPWFPTLLELMVGNAIILEDRYDLFLPGALGSNTPMKNPRWKAAAAKICGTLTKNEV
jgi:hypothetical protein